jgi:hypothetical protein
MFESTDGERNIAEDWYASGGEANGTRLPLPLDTAATTRVATDQRWRQALCPKSSHAKAWGFPPQRQVGAFAACYSLIRVFSEI